jgi:hypothetical protein
MDGGEVSYCCAAVWRGRATHLLACPTCLEQQLCSCRSRVPLFHILCSPLFTRQARVALGAHARGSPVQAWHGCASRRCAPSAQAQQRSQVRKPSLPAVSHAHTQRFSRTEVTCCLEMHLQACSPSLGKQSCSHSSHRLCFFSPLSLSGRRTWPTESSLLPERSATCDDKYQSGCAASQGAPAGVCFSLVGGRRRLSFDFGCCQASRVRWACHGAPLGLLPIAHCSAWPLRGGCRWFSFGFLSALSTPAALSHARVLLAPSRRCCLALSCAIAACLVFFFRHGGGEGGRHERILHLSSAAAVGACSAVSLINQQPQQRGRRRRRGGAAVGECGRATNACAACARRRRRTTSDGAATTSRELRTALRWWPHVCAALRGCGVAAVRACTCMYKVSARRCRRRRRCIFCR